MPIFGWFLVFLVGNDKDRSKSWLSVNPWPLVSVTPWHERRTSNKKKMVGGIGFLLHGNMLVGVCKNSLIVRVGPDGYEATLWEPHVKEFDSTERPMKGWVLVEPGGVEDNEGLTEWIQRAVKFAGKLAGK